MPPPPDAIALLQADWDRILDGLDGLEAAVGTASSQRAAEVVADLRALLDVVEQVLFPAVEYTTDEIRQLVMTARDDFAALDAALARFSSTAPDDPAWSHVLRSLVDVSRRRADADRALLFPLLRQYSCTGSLEDLAEQVTVHRRAAPLRLAVTYILPLLATEVDEDLVAYVGGLPGFVEDVIVVDGSSDDVFAELHRRWRDIRHVRPAVDARNGKVANVLTGVAHARHDLVVIADDDVRWDRPLLADAVRAMADAEVGRPQNHFDPAPWHARWDTGRILLNRAIDGDWPGTMLVRRSALRDGYAGDCVFENLELVRTVLAGRGRERVLYDVIVPRRPPTTAKFLSQRVRQAYDEHARPVRCAVQLALLPVLLVGRTRAMWRLALLATVLAEAGRRRGTGRDVWPATAALWAPAWMLERSVTAWLAIAARARGGVRFGNARLTHAAHRHPTVVTPGATAGGLGRGVSEAPGNSG